MRIRQSWPIDRLVLYARNPRKNNAVGVTRTGLISVGRGGFLVSHLQGRGLAYLYYVFRRRLRLDPFRLAIYHLDDNLGRLPIQVRHDWNV